MIAGAASLLRQDTLPVAAFGGTEDTFKAFGEAGTRLANIFGNYAQSMAQAADEGNFAAADRLVTEAKAAHAVETSTMPESQWADVWQKKYLPKLQEQIGAMTMTPAGHKRLQAWWTDQQGNTNADIAISANKQFIQNATQEGLAFAERERLNGNTENAFGIVGRLAARGMISSGDKERILLGWEKEDKAKTNETVWANTIADVQAYHADPNNTLDGLSKEIDEAIASKTWKTDHFPQYNGKRQELLRLQSVIKSEERDALITRKRDALEAIVSNQFQDADEIRKTYVGLLPQTEVDNLVATFEMTPDQIATRLAQQPALRRMVREYRPQDDPDGIIETNLISAIHGQPAGFQQSLLEDLRESKRQSKPEQSSYVEDLLKLANEKFKQGEYGKWRMDTNGNPKDVQNEWAPARMRLSERTDAFRAWARKNPQEASDPMAVNKAWNEIETDFYQKDKAAGFSGKQPAMMQPPDPAAVKARVQDARKGASAAQSGTFLDWMKNEEGFSPTAYWDSGQTSVGYGTRGKPGEKLTEEEAAKRLTDELSASEKRVNDAADKYGVNLTPSMREALASFDYNTGVIDKVMARKDPTKIAEAMLLYKHADAKAKDGVLEKRRQREVQWFWKDGRATAIPAAKNKTNQST